MGACLPLTFIKPSSLQKTTTFPISETRILLASSFLDILQDRIPPIWKMVATLPQDSSGYVTSAQQEVLTPAVPPFPPVLAPVAH